MVPSLFVSLFTRFTNHQGIAAVLMTAGVGLFGTFTGFVASWFLEEEEEDRGNHIVTNLKDEVSSLRGEIADLKKLIENKG